jgi:hypothetical protein
MEIKEFMQSHPAISYSYVEKELGIPHGMFREKRPIPEAYRERIAALLSDYGYNVSVEKEKPAEGVKTGYIVKRITSMTRDDRFAYKIGRKEGILFRVIDIPDGSIVTII